MTTNTEQQESQKFIFEGNEYEADSLSPHQISVIQSVQVADQKLASMNAELLLLSTGREALLNDLRESLTSV